MNFYKLILEELHSKLSSIKGIEDILVTGSVARGEETILNEKYLMSDIDLVILVKPFFTNHRKKIVNSIIDDVEKKVQNKTPFFDISVKFSNAFTYKKRILFNKNIGNFELFNNAISLNTHNRKYNDEYIIDDRDLYQINILIIVRLWKQLANNININISNCETYHVYAICRNTLDAATILLPNLGVFLPNYNKRNAAMDGLNLDKEFVLSHNHALSIKKSPEQGRALLECYSRFIMSYSYVYNKIVGLRGLKPFSKHRISYKIYFAYNMSKLLINLTIGNTSKNILFKVFQRAKINNEELVLRLLLSYHWFFYQSKGGNMVRDNNIMSFNDMREKLAILSLCNPEKMQTLVDVEILLESYVRLWRTGDGSCLEVIKRFR